MTKYEIRRCDPNEPSALELLDELSSDLVKKTGRDGRESFDFSDVKVSRSAFLVAYHESKAIGCGALRPFDEVDEAVCEVKRMYSRSRGKGIGAEILSELEEVAREFGFNRVRVETGIENEGGIGFYQRHGYKICENWGKYKGRPECVCFEKSI